MSSNRNINSSEIAKIAGVSRSTVSKVINNYPDIPEKTRKKVLDAISDHNYKPNRFASVLKGIPQKVIALYIHTTSNDTADGHMNNLDSAYMMGVVSNFIMATKQHDHSLLVEMIHEDEDAAEVESRIRDNFNSKSICAAVFVGLTDNSLFIDNLVESGYNIASIDRNVSQEHAAINVTTDDEGGAYRAAKHLAENGFSHIAFIGGDETKLSARSREDGYKRAATEYGMTPVVIGCGYSEKLGSLAVNRFVELSEIDALVCASDAIAHGFIGKMREIDSNRLDGIGLIGFENIAFNDYQNPSLSSVAIDYQQMANDTVESLLKPEKAVKVCVNTELIVRDSSMQ
ncbi:LacI family transcriptional regulator [Photobacterium sanctipauli]|uniref:LacI family transcriptional regulator n=1 Tax=Photobacterium sanctipauli TaxID=1342794 RepID=A0A2T3P0Z9_9GAMM|nr:LacI family DNA-binding transcriptional regulator [Photobacterium sanctipauli]PSW22152.1 LacI family transcriptional regulator [Photobacterium sanctipauli]